jgi:molybdenum cofactor synthesis domain-containing protein
MNSRAVCAVIIGNEVLTAKVTEANGALLIRRLRERGVELNSVHLVRDEVDEIVEQLLACRRRARYVITSGGVGPTHDDVTVRAVALALQRPVVRLPEMEARIRGYYGERPVPAEALRMAEAPAGASLVPSADPRFPVLECDGVFMLPGVPQLFKVHLEAVLARLPGKTLAFGQLFLSVGEPEIAAALDAIALARPHVAIGSYPLWGEGLEHKVRLTIEHERPDEVRATMAALEAALGASAIVRREGP